MDCPAVDSIHDAYCWLNINRQLFIQCRVSFAHPTDCADTSAIPKAANCFQCFFFLQYGKFWFDMCIRLGWYLCKLPTMKGLPIITRPAFNQIDNQNVGSLYQKNCKEQWNLTELIILPQFLTKVKKNCFFFDRICVSFFFSWMANREFDQPLS